MSVVEKKGSSSGSRVLKKLLNIDIFGEDVGFTVADGERKHKTICGAFFTLLVTSILVAFGAVKLVELEAYENTNFITIESKNERYMEPLRIKDTKIKF